MRGKYEENHGNIGWPYLIEYSRGADSIRVIEKMERPEPFENEVNLQDEIFRQMGFAV